MLKRILLALAMLTVGATTASAACSLVSLPPFIGLRFMHKIFQMAIGRRSSKTPASRFQ